MNTSSAIAVIGAGSWGTALAMLLANNGHSVFLWDKDQENLKKMAAERCNHRYLGDITLPDAITISEDFAASIAAANDILLVVPSHVFRYVLGDLQQLNLQNKRIVWASKGLDPDTDQLLCEVANEVLQAPTALAALSGPTFAREVALQKPSAITLAANDKALAEDWQRLLSNDYFHVYLCDDMRGVCLSGAVKNVLAIATGIIDGLAYGANARAALITLGLQEMIALGTALDAQAETFYGLAGLGDLVLTCSDDQSRNRRFGLALGKGIDVHQAKTDIGQVVEGEQNALQVQRLAVKHKINMPICHAVYRILNEKIPVKDAVKSIW